MPRPFTAVSACSSSALSQAERQRHGLTPSAPLSLGEDDRPVQTAALTAAQSPPARLLWAASGAAWDELGPLSANLEAGGRSRGARSLHPLISREQVLSLALKPASIACCLADGGARPPEASPRPPWQAFPSTTTPGRDPASAPPSPRPRPPDFPALLTFLPLAAAGSGDGGQVD